MKKFLSKFALVLLCALGLSVLTGVTAIGIMSSVHNQSFKDELFDRFPALEQKFEKNETSKDDDIVIEDENEDQTGTAENGETGSEEQTEPTEQGEEPIE